MSSSNIKNRAFSGPAFLFCLVLLFILGVYGIYAGVSEFLFCQAEKPVVPVVGLKLESLVTDNSDIAHPEFIFYGGGSVEDVLPEERDVSEAVICFYESLDVEREDLWVNLAYRKPERILSGRLEQTRIGRILLESDLQLKKDVMEYLNENPDFQSVPLREVRVWIKPGETAFYEDGTRLHIICPHLKVCISAYDRSVLKGPAEAMLKKIECRVNLAPEYHSLRELYKVLLMSQWYRFKYPFFRREGIPSAVLAEVVYPGRTSWKREIYWRRYLDLSRQADLYKPEQPGRFFKKIIVWGGISFSELGAVPGKNGFAVPDIVKERTVQITAKVRQGEIEIKHHEVGLPAAEIDLGFETGTGMDKPAARAEKEKSGKKKSGTIRAPPQIIASAGYRDKDTPSDTLKSFIKALEAGADGVEVDLRLTADGEVVTFHDERLDELTTGSGPLEGHTFTQLRGLGFRCQGRLDFSERIPLFEEVLKLVRHYSGRAGKNISVYLDMKTLYDPDSGKMLRTPANLLLLEKTIRLMKAYPGINFVFNSFFPEALREMRGIDRKINLCYDLGFYTPELLERDRGEIIETIEQGGIQYVHLSGNLLDEPFARELEKRGVLLTANCDSITAEDYFGLMGRGVMAVGVKNDIEKAVEMRKSGNAMARNIKLFPWFMFFMGLVFHSSYQQVFLQQAGYSLETIGWAFTLFSLIFSVASWPLGILADKAGKKKLLFLCGFLNAAGILLLAFSGIHPAALIVSQFFSAFAQSGFAVAANALLYESTSRIKQNNNYASFLGKAYSVFWVAMAVSTVSGSALATIFSLQAVILLSAVSSLGAIFTLFFFSPVPPAGGTAVKTGLVREVIVNLSAAFKNKSLRKLLFLDLAVGQGISVLIGFFLQPMLSLSGIALVYFGVISFAYGLVQSLSAKFAPHFTKIAFSRFLRTAVFALLGLLLAASFILGNSVTLVVMFFGALFFWDGLSGVVIDARIQEKISDSFRSQWFGVKSVLGGLTLILIQSFVNVTLAVSGITVAVFAVISLLIFISLLIKTES
ncbi:MAG: MFS transporter [Candidatus Omnitrophica bacterium]|nr:MFS transporter [Candidatus Omnitrophota bacterium]